MMSYITFGNCEENLGAKQLCCNCFTRQN